MVDETYAAGRQNGRRLDGAGLALGLGLVRHLAARFAAERERWTLWCPAGFGLGIAFYYALPVEPWPWLGAVVAVPLLAFAFWARRTGRARAPLVLAVALGLVAAGFAAAQWEVSRAAAPVLTARLGPVPLAGRIARVEILPDSQRVTVAVTALADWAPDRLPRFVRLRLDPGTAPAATGETIAATVVLLPPPAPDLAGGFDFQRAAYLAGLGAVGYAIAPATLHPGRENGLALWIARLREAMTRRIEAALPGPEGAVAAALITGEKGAIPEATAQDFRDAGLAHLLVIAGLHMTLVTGCAFFLLRGGLALVPRVALRHPIKKWAALAALALACLYLVISGAAVPTQRAFVMCALALVAILADRIVISLETVAWAAMLVLALSPSALLGGSFQMSFSAVVCLIAFYETYGGRLMAMGIEAGVLRRFGLHLLGIAVTTLVVTIGTAPFAIYHFDRFPVFSVLANVLAVPVSAFWIMPWALAACLLMPLGGEVLALTPMGWGIRLVEAIAHWTARLPGDIAVLPAMPAAAIAAVTLGGLWLALWRGSWRLWGLLPVLVGMVSLALVRPPDIFVSADGRLVALRDGGAYRLTTDRSDAFAAREWMELTGHPQAKLLPAESFESFGGGTLSCAGPVCRWRRDGRVVALIRRRLAPHDPCPEADLVIATSRLPDICRDAALALGPDQARRDGARSIWLGRDILMRAANAGRGRRPWVLPAQ